MFKRIFVLFICFIFCVNPALAADISLLYKVENTNNEQLKKIITPVVDKRFSKTIKGNDYFIAEKDGSDIYSVIILKNNDPDCYFYFLSNKNDETLKDEILKTLKNNDFEYKSVRDKNLKSYFYGEAYTNISHSPSKTKTISEKTKQNLSPEPLQNDLNYDFSDEAQENFDKLHGNETPIVLDTTKNQINISPKNIRLPEINSSGNIQSQKLTGGVVYINEGASLTAGLLSNITSNGIANNDRISAELDQDWIFNNLLIAPKGSVLNGHAIDTKAAGFAMGNGRIGLEFTELMTPDGEIIPLTTNKVYIIGETNRALNITKRVAAGAAVGLLISAISMLGGVDPGRALITGVGIGAAGGAFTAALSKGEEVQVIEGSQIQVTLTKPMSVQPYKK